MSFILERNLSTLAIKSFFFFFFKVTVLKLLLTLQLQDPIAEIVYWRKERNRLGTNERKKKS